MINAQLVQLALSAVSNAFLFSQTSAYNKEVVDGGTKNKIWSFVYFIAGTPWVLSPMAVIFPNVSFELYQWLIVGLSGGIFYAASIAHHNQICINQNELEKISKLPFDLHENQYLMRAVLFLSHHLGKVLIPFYVLSLVGCVFLGAPIYGYISLSAYTLNLLYQNDYFPSFLAAPFRYLNVLAVSSASLGATSWSNIALFISGIGFTIFDYVICHLRNEVSPTSQFPMADPKNKLTVMTFKKDTPEGSKTLSSLINKHKIYKSTRSLEGEQVRFGFPFDWIFKTYSRWKGTSLKEIASFAKHVLFHETIAPNGSHVTFNHFYESYQIVEKILVKAPPVNYDDYLTMFNQANFESEALRDIITNQMSLHDKYNQKSSDERCVEFGLPVNTSPVDVQIAYLRREMTYFVERLKSPSFRDLNQQQVAVLHQYARLILPKITNLPIEERDANLVSLALTTGSHCNRIYLETLSSMAEALGVLIKDTLTVRENAIVQAQAARETIFRTYYYKTVKLLKQNNPIYDTIFSDIDDYHTYETFVQMFGANFYLRNPTLTLRNRTTTDVYRDQTMHYSLSKLGFKDEKMLFSQMYTPSYLVEQVLDSRGKLHKIFIDWCEEHFPNCYKEVLFDEDFLLKTNGNTKALAELMLLDLDILDLDTAYSDLEVPTEELAALRLPIVVQQEAMLYLNKKSMHITTFDNDCWDYERLLEKIKKDGVVVIWDEIKDRVVSAMFDEFDMLYGSKEDLNFIKLVDMGKNVKLLDSSYSDLESGLWERINKTTAKSP